LKQWSCAFGKFVPYTFNNSPKQRTCFFRYSNIASHMLNATTVPQVEVLTNH